MFLFPCHGKRSKTLQIQRSFSHETPTPKATILRRTVSDEPQKSNTWNSINSSNSMNGSHYYYNNTGSPKKKFSSFTRSLPRMIGRPNSWHGLIPKKNLVTIPEDFHRSVLSFSSRNKASEETWFGQAPTDVPLRSIDPLVPDIFTSYTGPEEGLVLVDQLLHGEPTENDEHHRILGARAWNVKSRKAYGIATSLYDQHPVNGKISGDPIADSFAICARKNNAVLVIADGVNWGEKSKLAARCAVYGCMQHMYEKLFLSNRPVRTTQDCTQILLDSFYAAHDTIIKCEGGLTTLNATLVVPLSYCRQFAVLSVNVGDSLAYVFSKFHGVREISIGSHDLTAERDIRDAGGALGPVDGENPELHNLTCTMTICDPGDIVFLTTDGISDNFDPVVTKLAQASRRFSSPDIENPPQMQYTKPEMEPKERHQYSVKEMERIIHEFELDTESPCSAQELCGALLQHVLKLTDNKRKVLEDPNLYGQKLRSKERKRRDSQIVEKMSKAPGKLDHASIVAYEVGRYHGNDDENYEMEEVEDIPLEDIDLVDDYDEPMSPIQMDPYLQNMKIAFETSL